MGHVPARRRSLYFHGQNDNTMQTSSGFKYWLTKSSIMSSTYSVIKTSQLANVAGSAWKSNPQMGFKVSATAFSLLGSMMTLSIAWIRIWQAVQDKSFLASISAIDPTKQKAKRKVNKVHFIVDQIEIGLIFLSSSKRVSAQKNDVRLSA